ncbi:MAG: DUF885 domain-containing protein [Deltaproteobacteria bacterium]|nr:DUF885 domain-containing protein [Deltaproteobacteria bacterium]
MKKMLALALALSSACSGGAKRTATPGSGSADGSGSGSAVATPTPDEPPPPAGPSLDERRAALNALLAEQWEYQLKRAPEFASILGDPRYNDRWSDMSPEAIAADLAATRVFRDKFAAIDTTGFPEQEALNKELMVRGLEQTLDDAKFEDWLQPVTQQFGIHIMLPQLASFIRLATVKDYEDYIARLNSIPTVFAQITALMRTGMAKGLIPPKILLEQCVGQAAGLARQKPADSPFAAPIAKFPKDMPKADQDRLRAAILEAIKTKVLPSYATFTTFLKDEYVPKGRAEPGLWSLPDGVARYAARVKDMTTTDMTPDEIHEIGLKEVARIEGLQAAIGKDLGFPDFATFKKKIRADKKLYAKSRKEILARYEKYVAQMYEKLPALFGRLPKKKMTIEAVESYREKEASGAQYSPGTPDGSRPGRVQVNTFDPTKRLTIDMESTAYHEGVPGHHLQIAIQQELGELPPFRQQGGYNAYAEGWALYSEGLGKEVGFYQDPYNDYGRLQDEMLRAIRLVVDTGFHAKKWTRKQVVDFFHDHSTIDEVSVQSETDRYIGDPGQALGYKVGQLTILRLRHEAEAALGAKFDIRAFHDEVLGAGALPLDVLERRIHAWIARQK